MFKLNAEANRYLIAQRGDLASRSSDLDRFQQAWSDEINKTIKQLGIEPKHVLDLGSGLGLIDIELVRRYNTYCSLVDGEEPPPVFKHADPFCCRRVVEDFWRDNEIPVTSWRYMSPEQVTTQPLYGNFDCVISLRSWCFHYPPRVYMETVRQYLAPKAVVLLDVRRNRLDTHDEWLAELAKEWPDNEVLETGEKYDRIRFEIGGDA